MCGFSSSTGWAFDAAFPSADHSALPCIFSEDIKIPLEVSYIFVILFSLATTFGYKDREANYCGEALIVYGNFVSVGNLCKNPDIES